MNLDLLNQFPTDFAPTSKVWIYQSNKPLQDEMITEMNEQLKNFYLQWMSHGAPVKGWAQIVLDRFIVVIADENQAQVGGCSTDSMVRIIKSFERQYQLNLFDRMSISFYVNNKVEPLPLNQINYALEKGYIETDTPLFNNAISTKEELSNNWMIPLDKSWLWSRIAKRDV